MTPTHGENLIQGAIMDSLAAYCAGGRGRPQLWQFPTYANQQGGGLRKYCGDIIGMLDNAALILLEVKELDCLEFILPEFKEEQHADLLFFEEVGLPIAYAYNGVSQLAYHENPRQRNWVTLTLGQVKRSVPSLLPGANPDIDEHQNLLQWLRNARGADALRLFGQAHGLISSPSDLRNGILVLLYGVSMNVLAALSDAQLQTVVSTLKNNPNLSPAQRAKMQLILGASSDVLSRFSPASTSPGTPRP